MGEKTQIPAATMQRMSLMKNVLGQKIDRRKKDKKEETERQGKLEDKMAALGLSEEAKQQVPCLNQPYSGRHSICCFSCIFCS
jgi:hypothetical protein